MMERLTASERLLLSLGIEQPEEIDLEAIAWHLGAVVREDVLQGCEAMILGSSTKAVIVVNRDSIETRKRFSIAHEIGHWLHHRGQHLFCAGNQIGNPRTSVTNPEAIADGFASDLILPPYMTAPLYAGINKLNLAIIRETSARFKASTTATLISMVKSNRFPIMVVCHGPNGRRWFWASKMVQSFWWPREDLDRDTFAYGLMYGGAAEENWPRSMPAEAWFNFNGCDRYEVKEQSFRISDSDIMTVLAIPDGGLN